VICSEAWILEGKFIIKFNYTLEGPTGGNCLQPPFSKAVSGFFGKISLNRSLIWERRRFSGGKILFILQVTA